MEQDPTDQEPRSEEPILYIVATPIGNMRDITYRAVDVLGAVSALACEDTRVTQRLLTRYGIARPRVIFSCHEHNEVRASRRIVELLGEGLSVAYCSDAGMPGISDPGYLMVRAALDAGFRVEVIPGPSASTTALVVSGLPNSSFAFLGFAPRKSGQRRRLFERLVELRETLVFYESPHRIDAFLADALEILGNRQAAVAVELTKMFESVDRGWLADLARRAADGKSRGQKRKGEITVVIAGANPKFRSDDTDTGDGDGADADVGFEESPSRP